MSGKRRKTESYGTRRKEGGSDDGNEKERSVRGGAGGNGSADGTVFYVGEPGKTGGEKNGRGDGNGNGGSGGNGRDERWIQDAGRRVGAAEQGRRFLRNPVRSESGGRDEALRDADRAGDVGGGVRARERIGGNAERILRASRGRSGRQGSESGGADGGRREGNIVRAGERAVGESEPRV